MLSDRFNRRIDYLRISVTDRCNHHCVYCMPGDPKRTILRLGAPEAPFVYKESSDILSYEQIKSLTKVAAKMGITKVRLTGGEPMVRKDIEHLVAKLAAIEGIDEVCMTTNGSLLADRAMKLKRSGLGRVNISIDSLNADKYHRITRGGDLRKAIAGVDAAIEAELTLIKINMIILDDSLYTLPTR
ncbi:radical SAM protein [Planctomycetota bacterium]